MFKRLPELAGETVPISIDGRSFAARQGDTVAAALLASGASACRTTPVSGVARGPYCMMGVCFDCLVMIDGKANQQGCMILVAPNMRIERQQGAHVVAP